MSDFHGSFPDRVPPCDLMLLAGDYGIFHGTTRYAGEILPFMRFLERVELPSNRIIGIAGNHDYWAERDPEAADLFPWTYLQDRTVEVNGLKIHGAPWTKTFLDWAFELPEEHLSEKWAMIPDDVDVLITHGPPHGIGDLAQGREHVGSRTLRKRIGELAQLKLHVFGHIHEARGCWVKDGIIFANVTSLRRYEGNHEPFMFTLDSPKEVSARRTQTDQPVAGG